MAPKTEGVWPRAVLASLLVVALSLVHAGMALAVPRPNTTLTATPPTATTSTSASFSFISSTTSATFQCRLDGDSYAPCTSPKTYTGLTVGSHTFYVRAVKGTSTDRTPATHTWRVDPALAETVSEPVPAPLPEPEPVSGRVASFEGSDWSEVDNNGPSATSNTSMSFTSERSYSGLKALKIAFNGATGNSFGRVWYGAAFYVPMCTTGTRAAPRPSTWTASPRQTVRCAR